MIIITIVAGCSSAQEEVASEQVVKLEDVVKIDYNIKSIFEIDLIPENFFEQTEDVVIGSVIEMEVDDGKVLMGDYSSLTIHVFNPDGSHLRDLGNKGVGPGEFQTFSGMGVESNHLYIFDRAQFKMHVYDLESFAYIHSINVRQYPKNSREFQEIIDWIPMYFTPLYDSTSLVGFVAHPRDSRRDKSTYNLGKYRPIKYFFMDYEGNIRSKKLFELKTYEDIVINVGGEHLYNYQSFPFLGNSLMTLSKEKNIFTAWTKDFLIKMYNPDGTYKKAFYIPDYHKRKIRREELQNLFDEDDERNQKLIQYADLPEYWPALYTIETDDKERLWVATITEGKNFLQWWVFDTQGRLLGKVNQPGEIPLKWLLMRPLIVIKDGYFYQRERSVETGIDRVVKYRIEFIER